MNHSVANSVWDLDWDQANLGEDIEIPLHSQHYCVLIQAKVESLCEAIYRKQGMFEIERAPPALTQLIQRNVS